MADSVDQRTVAFHEAGHAVIALKLGRPVHRVSIASNEMRLGQCQLTQARFRPSDDAIETQMLIYLGGLAAEARHTGQYCWAGAGQDLQIVKTLADFRTSGGRGSEKLVRRMLDKTEHLLSQPELWRATELIAEALCESTTISGRAARHHYDRALRETPNS